MHVCYGTGMWRSKGNLGESVLSIYPVSEILLSLLDLASVYALSHFAGLGKCFKNAL